LNDYLPVRFSLRSEYALRALIRLGDSYDGEVVSIQEIAEQQGIPKRFLEQILNELRAGDFVESKRGIAGGYRLARPPEEVTLAQVLRHVEGTLAPVAQWSEKPVKLNPQAAGAQQAIRAVMKNVREAVVTVLEHVSLAELCAQARRLQGNPVSGPEYFI
jgi:Rrf2 family protein